jgi:hypothetical protein
MGIQYPRFVFTSPGPVSCQGGTYGQELVYSREEHQNALDAGFFATLPEALEAAKSQLPKPAGPVLPKRVKKAAVAQVAVVEESEGTEAEESAPGQGGTDDDDWTEPNLDKLLRDKERSGGGNAEERA